MGLPLRFHWNPFDGRWPGNGALAEACRFAEECGIESVLVNIEPTLDDPLVDDPLVSDRLAPFVAAGDTSRKIRFMAGFGTSSMPAEVFAHQINALSELLPGRILIHIPFDRRMRPLGDNGGSSSIDEEHYAHIQDLLTACCRLCRPSPEIFLEGNSAEAAVLAIKFADCLWHLPKRPEQVYSDALPILHMGKEVGLCVSPIARTTAEEAHASVSTLLPTGRSDNRNESSGGSPCLWTGDATEHCPNGMALVGSFEEVAEALMRYKEKGISQFLLSGLHDKQEMMYFAEGVLPIVRRHELA